MPDVFSSIFSGDLNTAWLMRWRMYSPEVSLIFQVALMSPPDNVVTSDEPTLRPKASRMGVRFMSHNICDFGQQWDGRSVCAHRSGWDGAYLIDCADLKGVLRAIAPLARARRSG